MSDLLIRNIDPALKRRIEESARVHRRSLSAETKALIRRGLGTSEPPMKMGTWMASLVRPEDRGDDLIFEIPGEIGEPPDLK